MWLLIVMAPLSTRQDKDKWAALKTETWCYYNNDASNENTYGKLL
jgi:hypothetical protein